MAEPFVWGAGGAQLSPAAIAERRKVAQAMMMQGSDFSPIQSPWQGAARVAQAMMGGVDALTADRAEAANVAAERQLLGDLLAPGASAAAAPAAPAAAVPAGVNPTSAASPMGRLPSMNSRVYDQNEFNPMDAAVATPAELAAGVPAPAKYAALIGKAAVDNDLPPALLAAQLKQESGFNPNAMSSAGAAGISQFMPGTAREMGVSDPFNPAQAIPAGANYLRQNIDKFGGSVPLGLAAYNAGPGRVAKAGGDISRLPAETQGYVANITGAAPTAPAAASPAAQQVAQAINPKLVAAMSSPYVSDGTKKILGAMLQQQMKPPEYGFTTLPDGTILRQDPRRGTVEPIYTAATKPTFTKVGTDPTTGQDVMGFVDPNGRKVEEYKPPAQANAGPSTIPPPPAGVDPKVWREAQSKRATEEGMPAGDEKVSKLRNEVQGLPSYKNIAQAAPVYKSMLDAAGRDNRAADLNLIYGIAKVFDPGSVVREGEMGMAQGIATLPERLQAQVKSALTGEGRLTPELRTAIMQEARSRLLAYQGMFDQDMGMYRGIAQRGRMSEADVIPSFGTFDEFKPPAAVTAPVEIDGYKIRAK